MNLRSTSLIALFISACSGAPSGNDAGTGGGVPFFSGGGGGGGTGAGGGSSGGGTTGGGTTGGGTTGGGMTGGGGATGGGVTGGGTTGGGTTGGGGATGGGGQVAMNGTILRVGMSDQLVAPAPDGSMHMLFTEGAAERVIYGRCTAGCANPSAWNFTQLLDHAEIATLTVGVSGLAVDSSGRIHAMVDGVSQSGTDPVLYATCASNCSVGANWAVADLSGLLHNGTVSVISGLTVAPNGTIGVIGRGAFGNYMAYYATCSANCTASSSWASGAVIDGTVYYLAIDGAGVSHALFSAGTTAAGERLHYYARCASNCTQAASWQKSTTGFVHSTDDWTAGFTVTPSGRVFLSFNQGTTQIGASANNTLFVNTCLGATCTDLANWSSISIINDEREDDTWLAHDGESVALVTATTLELHFRACNGNCQTATNWSGSATLDTFTAIAQAIPPDTGSSCAGNAVNAFWYPQHPRAASSTAGVVVGFTAYALVNCPATTSAQRMPPIGRLFSTF